MAEPERTVWNKDEDRATAEASATAFDAAVGFDSSAVFFDGYDPTNLTKEGEVPVTWAKEDE